MGSRVGSGVAVSAGFEMLGDGWGAGVDAVREGVGSEVGSAVGSETEGRVASPVVPQAPTSTAIDPTNASAVSVRFMTPPMQT